MMAEEARRRRSLVLSDDTDFSLMENVHLLLYTTLHPASGGYRIGENIKQDICVCVNFTYLKVAAADFAALLGNDFLNGSWMLAVKGHQCFKKIWKNGCTRMC